MESVFYGWQPLADILAEPNARELIEAYFEELWPLKGVAPLDPDWPRLLRLEAEGIYKVWTARVDSTLAAFCSFYIEPHVLSRDMLFAVSGEHFLAPAYRDNGRIGWRLWRTAGAALKKMGVKVAMPHDNAGRPLMPFFLALGAKPQATLFLWVL